MTRLRAAAPRRPLDASTRWSSSRSSAIREFAREPEAVFWAIFFPILLTTGLGIAFRSQPPAGAADRDHSTPELAASLRTEPGLAVDVLSRRTAARRRCASARSPCSSSRAPTGGVVYRYDDTNPEGRTARALADDAVQRAAGRTDPVPATRRR